MRPNGENDSCCSGADYVTGANIATSSHSTGDYMSPKVSTVYNLHTVN